jgi:hypothetical protein
MKKNTKKTTVPATPKVETPKPAGPIVTTELIAQLREADSLDAAIKVLAPPSRVPVNATYALNAACNEPLPARRGAALKVIATAIRLDKAFTTTDITTALPDVKAARYWVNRLVKSGHLTVTE